MATHERGFILVEVDAENLTGVTAAVQAGLKLYYEVTNTQPFGPIRLGVRDVHERVLAAFNYKENE